MNMKKMKLAFIVSLFLFVGTLFAGCSSQKADSPQGQSGTGESNESAAQKDITVSVYDRGSVPPNEGTSDNNRWTKWLNEEGPANVKFVPIPRWESAQKMNVLFASNSAPDLILEFDAGIRNQWYIQKQLMPIDEIVEKYSKEYKKLLETYPEIRKLTTRSDGKMYEFARILGLRTNHYLYVRSDWLKKLNLDVPKTTDDFYTVAKAFTEQDPDGNGKNDTYGMNFSFVGGLIMSNMFQSVNWIIENGQMVRDWDRTAEMISLMKKFYDEGIVDKDFITDTNGQKAQQDFVTGKLGMFGANAGGDAPGFQIYEALKKNVPDAEIIPIPLPKSPFGQYSPVLNVPIQLTGVVNARAKNTDAIMKYVDFMSTDETNKTLKYGFEGIHSKRDARGCYTPIDAEKFKEEVSWTGDLAMLTNIGLEGECAAYVNSLNPENPMEKQFLNIIKLGDEAYLSEERPIPNVVPPDYFPQLPENLQTLSKNMEKSGAAGAFAPGIVLADIWAKAVIGGTNYTPEQAKKDAQEAWEKGGGKQIEEYYKEWYAENKDKAFLTKDLYTFQQIK